MKSDEPMSRSRRALLTGGAFVVPGMLLAGCSLGDEPEADRSTSSGRAAAPPQEVSERVVRLSVAADTGEDVTEAFAEAIEQVHPTQATTIELDRGVYLVRSIVIPTDRTVIIRGMGIGYVGGSFGTQIRRYDEGGEPVLLAQGTPGTLTSAQLNTPPYRTRLELYDLELHGNESGVGLRVFRGQQCNFERVRVTRCAGPALHLTQMFNSSLSRVFTSYSGQGDEQPAMLIDGTDEDSTAGTNTLHLTNCEWETNTGTDLVVDGYPGTPSVAVLIANAKLERGTGDFPLIRVTKYAKVQLDNSYLYLGSDTTYHLVETAGSLMLSNVHIASGGAPDYQVRHDDGLLMMVAVQSEARVAKAVLRVAAEVSVGRCVLRGVVATNGNRLVEDNRATSVKLGEQVVPVPLLHSVAPSEQVAGGLSSGWVLKPGADSPVCVGQVVLPDGLPDEARCEVVLRWSTNSGGGGYVSLRVTVGTVEPNASLTSRQKRLTAVTEAPSSAAVLMETTVSPAIAVQPGELVQVQVQRVSGDADTFDDDVFLLTAHLLVSTLP